MTYRSDIGALEARKAALDGELAWSRARERRGGLEDAKRAAALANRFSECMARFDRDR